MTLLYLRAPLCATAILLSCACLALGQTVINVPGDTSTIGGGIGSDTTLNLFAGGVIENDFAAGASDGSSTNVEVNVFGGEVGTRFQTHSGSVLNVSGGTVAFGATALPGGQINITGGLVQGASAQGGSVNIASGDIDGILYAWQGGVIEVSGGVTRQTIFVDSGSRLDISGGEVGVESRTGSLEAFAGSEVNISGGLVGNFAEVKAGAVLNLSGGAVGVTLLVEGGMLNVSGGTVGSSLSVRPAGKLNLSGGLIEEFATVESGAELTMSGGEIGESFDLLGDAIISGGYIGEGMELRQGSSARLSGGSIGDGLVAAGEELTVTGGTIGRRAWLRSRVTFTGGDFRLNGEPIDNLDGGLPEMSSFTGVLADGTTFAYSAGARDRIAPGVVTLISAPIDEPIREPMHIAEGEGPQGLRPQQDLTISGTATLGKYFTAIDGKLSVRGGEVGDALEVYGSEVELSGGTIGDDFYASDGSTVVISGGSIGSRFTAISGASVEVSGGAIGTFFTAEAGSVVSISGGNIGAAFQAEAGSRVELSGGTALTSFRASADSQVRFVGANFELNGLPIAELSEGLPEGGVLTGTLADGTVFAIAENTSDQIAAGTLELEFVPLDEPDLTPQFINQGEGPKGLHPGQELTLSGTASLRQSFTAVRATLHVEGGTVANGLELVDTQATISGGQVGSIVNAHAGTTLHVSGGVVGRGLTAHQG